MTKPFKLRLHLPSFQLCRSISSSILPNKSSSTHPSIPVNPKALDAAYARSPPPPPSSPDHPSSQCNAASKITPIGFFSERSTPWTAYVASIDNTESPAFGHNRTCEKLYNSPEVSAEFEASVWLKDDQSATMSVSPADSDCFSSEDEDDNNDQLSSCSSFSSFCDFGDHPLKSTPIDQKPRNENGRKVMKKEGKGRKLKSYVSNSWKATKLPCVVDGKVKESYAIMKKSADPFDDFKVSMLEMIQGKQISELEDLEKLLMCFLSLNAKDHHAVIVAAFTEVWEELYSTESQPSNSRVEK